MTLKLKRKDFRTLTRSVTLHEPTQLAQTLFRTTRPLLHKETRGGAHLHGLAPRQRARS